MSAAMRRAASVRRGVARPDQTDLARIEQFDTAFDGDDRRRVLEGGERLGIIRLGTGDQPGAELRQGFDLPLGLRLGADPHAPRTAPASGEVGQGVERLGRGAEIGDEVPDRHRADAAAARQAQPIQFFRIAGPHELGT